MRIKYYGENKERGWGRVAIIRFSDNEFDLYKYIAKYENAYGDETREFFNGRIYGIERDENGVTINEAYIEVEDFDDFNDLKANYKEAKKEFKSLKKQSTDTEPETATDPEITETATEAEPESLNNDMVKNLNINNFLKALIKTVGLEKTKEVRYTVQGVNVFFEFKGNMYKCYTPQSKLYKLSGQRFNLITWKELKKESCEKSDDNSDVMYTVRPPPDSSSAESVKKNKLIKKRGFLK